MDKVCNITLGDRGDCDKTIGTDEDGMAEEYANRMQFWMEELACERRDLMKANNWSEDDYREYEYNPEIAGNRPRVRFNRWV